MRQRQKRNRRTVQRVYRKADRLETDSCEFRSMLETKIKGEVPAEEANLVCSDITNPWDKSAYVDPRNREHSPALDIDFPARLVPSSTPGHYHLYLDGIQLSWERYLILLDALNRAGVIQDGFYEAAVVRGYTSLRPEGQKK